MVLKRFLLVILTLCLALSFAACGNAATEDASSGSIPQKYIVKVVTEGGMPLKDVTVMVYKDNTKTSLVNAGTTDDEGFLRFNGYQSTEYVAVLSGLPEGYTADSEYPVLSKDNEFSVKSALRNRDLEGAQLKLGDIAVDFEITDVKGNSYKLSELLETKKAVVLNFWFEGCDPCRMEFPYMQDSYEGYSDKLEIFAVNYIDGTQSSVKKYAEQLSLGFPFVSANAEWGTVFYNLYSYPTTVIIDRYGMIAFMHSGAITEKETFDKIFAYFTADDYVQKTARNISDLK